MRRAADSRYPSGNVDGCGLGFGRGSAAANGNIASRHLDHGPRVTVVRKGCRDTIRDIALDDAVAQEDRDNCHQDAEHQPRTNPALPVHGRLLSASAKVLASGGRKRPPEGLQTIHSGRRVWRFSGTARPPCLASQLVASLTLEDRLLPLPSKGRPCNSLFDGERRLREIALDGRP